LAAVIKRDGGNKGWNNGGDRNGDDSLHFFFISMPGRHWSSNKYPDTASLQITLIKTAIYPEKFP
jgi:hypothetical protein